MSECLATDQTYEHTNNADEFYDTETVLEDIALLEKMHMRGREETADSFPQVRSLFGQSSQYYKKGMERAKTFFDSLFNPGGVDIFDYNAVEENNLNGRYVNVSRFLTKNVNEANDPNHPSGKHDFLNTLSDYMEDIADTIVQVPNASVRQEMIKAYKQEFISDPNTLVGNDNQHTINLEKSIKRYIERLIKNPMLSKLSFIFLLTPVLGF